MHLLKYSVVGHSAYLNPINLHIVVSYNINWITAYMKTLIERKALISLFVKEFQHQIWNMQKASRVDVGFDLDRGLPVHLES